MREDLFELRKINLQINTEASLEKIVIEGVVHRFPNISLEQLLRPCSEVDLLVGHDQRHHF